MNIPDNYELWQAHDREQEQELEDAYHCEDCKKPIQDDYIFEIDGEILCEKCMIRRYRKDNDR